MFSEGKWHERVPRDMESNLRYRIGILKGSAGNADVQSGLMEMCRRDILFWINVAVWQYNPDLMGVGPFITKEFQEAALVGGEVEVGGVKRHQVGLLQCLDDRESVRWVKSRYVGATWLSMMVAVWLSLFHKNVKILAMSKDEKAAEEVDNPDSLFWKTKFMIEKMPGWMTGEVKMKKGVIRFPGSGNTITATANVESAGVGGRATMMIVDEFAQFEKGHEIYSMTSDTSDCRVFIFTHKGQDTMAYKLCYDLQYRGMREIITHWSQDKEKAAGLYRYDEVAGKVEVLDKSYEYGRDFEFDMSGRPHGGVSPGLRSPWYDKRCRFRSEYDIAMNLDIDPIGSRVTFFDAHRIGELKALHVASPKWVGDLIYDKERGEPIRFQESMSGLLKMWVNPKGEAELPMMRCGAGVDVSAGSGNSPSCLSVMNARTGEKILQYSNAKIFATDFAVLVAAILRTIKDEYGTNPLLVWEVQGSSAFARRIIEDIHYSPYYMREDADWVGSRRPVNRRPGWVPTAKSILTLMDEYRIGLYEGRCVNRDADSLDETMKFIYTSSSVEYKQSGEKLKDGSGALVHHGDMVRADALAYKMIKGMGLEGPAAREKSSGWLNPMTGEGRERLAELESVEEEEIWV